MKSKSYYAAGLLVLFALAVASTALSFKAVAQTNPVTVAPGFEFNLFADPTVVSEFTGGYEGAFRGPTAMAFDARGRLFVTTLSGKVLILLDNNDDGRVDQVKTFTSGLGNALGLTFRANGDLFVTSNLVPYGVGRVVRLRDLNGDDVADETTVIVDNLPSEGDHQTNRVKFGPDGLLYFGQGSSTDNGTPKHSGRPPERSLNATIMRVNVDTLATSVFATGLRNPFGMAFHPENGELFSTDGGSGELCQIGPCTPEDLVPLEEINWVVEGGNYGFPQCEGTPVPENPGCQGVRPPITQFNRHLTPTSVTFYTGPQAGQDRNQVLVTLFKRLGGQGGDLRRLTLTGDNTSGFQMTPVLPPIADFGIIDPFDGPIDTAIDPISGDIYVARLDVVAHADLSEHHHFIYRIHREGSDALPFISPPKPSSVKAGTGAVTINLIGRHLKPGAVVLADGVPVATRQGSTIFDLVADLPASATSTERNITIEVRNADGARSNPQVFAVSNNPGPGPDPEKSPQIGTVQVKKKNRVIDPVSVGTKAKKVSLVVTGIDFDSGAELLVNGTAVALTSSSATQLVGKFTKSMLAAPGELSVQVRNATGRTSNTVRLIVVAD